jgi:5'-deoxynucleotidase YfbR-like HD superfamily hydrolase
METYRLETILESGYVKRFHAQPHMPSQDLSQHQWRVAIMLQHFYGEVPSVVLMYALTHDCAELDTGDIPAPTKRISSGLKGALSAIEDHFDTVYQTGVNVSTVGDSVPREWQQRVKLCDMIEGLRYCAECVMTGNKFAVEVGLKWAEYLSNYSAPQTAEMVAYIAAQTKILVGEK